jgi:hypothetical protein
MSIQDLGRRGHGRAYSPKLRACALGCLSIGASANHVRELLLRGADLFIPGVPFDLPEIDWFLKLREQLGPQAKLFAFIEIAKAKEVAIIMWRRINN